MELSKTKSGIYILISASVLMLLLLGNWWLYLVFKLANRLETLNHPLIEGNLISMIKWEGLTFFILLLILTITLLYIYFQDHKKTKALHAFFASLTHELKTPLASMKLQAQVLNGHIEDSSLDKEVQLKLQKYTQRLLDDNLRLEDQLDNHLQLSRIERNAHLNLAKINFSNFIQNEQKRYAQHLTIELNSYDTELILCADDFALQTIFRNLLENSIRHCKSNEIKVNISVKEIPNNFVSITYTDNGQDFSGSTKRLGELFYKHNSPQGSGIGLYIVKQLTKQMRGQCQIETEHGGLSFILNFKQCEDKND